MIVYQEKLEIAENSPVESFIAHVLASDADFGSAGRVECRLTQPVEKDDDDDDDGGGYMDGYDDAQNFRLVTVFQGAQVGSGASIIA